MVSDGVYISEAAWKEFQSQDVFSTVEEFVEAMPPATAGVHTLPAEVAAKVDGFRPLAGAEVYFTSPTSQTFTHPGKEDPHADNESIWNVDHANDLAKDQGMRDETEIGQHSYQDPYDSSAVSKPEGPGEFDTDYAIHNYYRKFDSCELDSMALAILRSDPIILPLMEHRHGSRVAMRWEDIVRGLDPTIIKSSKGTKVRLKRADPKRGRWTFTATSKSGNQHTVHIKAVPKKGSNALRMPILDLKIGCSCEFWKWQGPDYHAQKHGYLDRKPRSNGAAPTQKDPRGSNRVCKHVYAASRLFLAYRLESKRRRASVFVPTLQGAPRGPRTHYRVDRVSAQVLIDRPTVIAHNIEAVAIHTYKG